MLDAETASKTGRNEEAVGQTSASEAGNTGPSIHSNALSAHNVERVVTIEEVSESTAVRVHVLSARVVG